MIFRSPATVIPLFTPLFALAALPLLLGSPSQCCSQSTLDTTELMQALMHQTSPCQYQVLHELNEGGTARTGEYHEGLGNFLLDTVFTFERL